MLTISSAVITDNKITGSYSLKILMASISVNSY